MANMDVIFAFIREIFLLIYLIFYLNFDIIYI